MRESYVLAVDIGTSRIAAARARVAPDGSIEASPIALGRRSDSVSTVVFAASDGSLYFGDAAERRGLAQPERLVREFKRGVGDAIPLTVGGRSFPAEELYAQTFVSIVDEVAEREGSRPDALSLTHPATWGAHRTGLVRDALKRLGIDDVLFMTEPEAAARHYEASRPLEPGQSLAVYDLGGGTFDSVVLRKGDDSSFRVVGEATGLDDLGGADFDDAVLRHVVSSSGIDVAELSADDSDTRLALAQLRRECIEAKEALSFDTDATIPLVLSANLSSVRLTRSEFEQMIDGVLDKTLDALDDTIDSAGMSPTELEAILLIGGSSRIPLVAQRLSERFDRPLAIDADPKASIALGAARTALVRLNDQRLSTDGVLAPVAATDALSAFDAIVAGPGSEIEPAKAAAASAPVPASAPAVSKHKPLLLAGAAVLVAGAIVIASTIAAGSLSNQDSEAGATPRPTATTITPAPKDTPALADPAAAEPVDDTPRSTSPNPRRNLAVESNPAPRPDTPRTTPPPAVTTPPTTQPSTPPDAVDPDPTEPSTPPTTDPSTPPDPEPSTDPSTPPPTDPEPDPDPDPSVDPEPETPAPDPGPDTSPAV